MTTTMFVRLIAGTLIVVLLALAAVQATAQAQEVQVFEDAPTSIGMQPDTDGWVYEGEDCDGNNWRMGHTDMYIINEWRWVVFPEGWWYDTEAQVSYYYYESEGWIPPGYDNKIFYDYCEMEVRGAGYNDYNTLYLHEEAHSRGWDHYEEPPYLNPAYEPVFLITGT